MLKQGVTISQAVSPASHMSARPNQGAGASMELRFAPAGHRICMWMGHVLTVMYLVGWLCARFLPIPGADWPADKLAAWLYENKTGYQLGCLLMLVAGGLLAPWGSALAIWTRKTEFRFPVLYLAQITSLAASTALFVIIPIFWALAVFRATEIPVDITQMLYDAGWYLFLWVGPPFYIWVCMLGLGIILNPPEHQLFPRWIGYYCLASVLCWTMGLMQVFFRTGPTAYNGMLPTWIPVIEFFIWMEILTFYGFKAIRKQEELCRAETEEGLGVYAPGWDDPLVDSIIDEPQNASAKAPKLASAKAPFNGRAPA